MKLEQFADAVLTAVREKADGIFTASAYRSEKNNGITQTGIVAKFPDSNISPCLYLDDYYIEYRNGILTVAEAAGRLYEKMIEGRDKCTGINTADFLEWDTVKSRIYPKLINAEWNRNQLPDLPHRMFLDFAVVYYLKITDITGKKENGTILIQNEYMKMWGQTENVLYEMAMENMAAAGNIRFQDILDFIPRDMLRDGDQDISREINRYILTSSCCCFGAAEILNEATLEGIYEQIGDFILLPCSVHETILIPESQFGDDYESFVEMVKCSDIIKL